ncbi:cation-translocating P-type ATPase [Variovorax sp. PBL-E5]|uniref:cation-translocating P-type ATPase n=1 Tax=Variovorax sp. PBL-E5 TaxID=434014 RepID=UPI0013A5B6A6|nr:cation-translocating P-type ATPase [Variovorax sp. PBL-E5]
MTHPLDSSAQGLDENEALARLRRDGPNVLPSTERKGVPRIAWTALTQPMFLLLLATAALYAVLGSLGDAAVLLVSVLVVGGLSIYQEQRTERVMHALRDLSSPRCTVVREGVSRRVVSAELVCGDRLVVNEGDRLAADARLVEAAAIQVDESQLTGESMPVGKHAGGTAEAALLHAGSLVVRGDGVAVVTATGANTALGRIGGSITRIAPRQSRLQGELKVLVRRVALLSLLTCGVAATVFALREGSWSAGLLVGLTLAMSLIPEEFAVVWSVMLALGAWRLGKSQVLTRQPQAIEALGTATVLCVDKTGTLTRNRMTLAALHDGRQGGRLDLRDVVPPHFHRLLVGAMRASTAVGVEPMDQAIFRAGAAAGLDLPKDWLLGQRQGVRDRQPYVVNWWRRAEGAEHVVVVKGAPEAVLALCDAEAAELHQLAEAAHSWSAEGLRVLAVAESRTAASGSDGSLPQGLRLSPLGLLGFLDPLRDEVPRAIEDCRRAGVRVVMITGDSALTAQAIARDAGLIETDTVPVMTGAQIAAMNDFELSRCIGALRVFARVDAAQKLRIVHALQAQDEIVAMTGDGVNDAPALRAADIGVAMGQRGTDVAREAAALVLMDDNFASLVDAVRAGRRIFLNLRKALGYLFAVHVPIVGVALIPVVLGGPVLLLPLHVVLLELLIDPACSLVFEAEPAPDDSMRVPPRRSDERLFSPAAAVRALALGSLAFAGVVLVQWFCRLHDAAPDVLRLASLGSIVLGNMLLLLWFRGIRGGQERANPAFMVLLAGVCIVWVLLLGVPAIGSVFGLPAVPAAWALAAALPAGWAVWRLARRRRWAPRLFIER